MEKRIVGIIKILSNQRIIAFSLIVFLWITLLLVWGKTIIPQHSILIEGKRYWFLADDAMISMRYARNFAHGIGLVWNPGENIEGYTNFLWVLVMSLIHFLQVPNRLTSFYIIILNIFLQLILLIVFFKLIREITKRNILAFILAAIFLIVDISSMVWGTAGFEMTLIAVLVTLGTYKIIIEVKKGEVHFNTFLLIGLISLVRADGIVITALFVAIIFALTGLTKRNFQGAILAITLFLMHLLFRFFYYGALTPNTATLKLFNLNERIAFGLNYFLIFFKWYWPIFLLILIQLIRDILQKKYMRPIIFFGAFSYVAYVVYIGGDGIGNNRFFVPIIPLIFVLGATSMVDMFNKRLLLIMTISIVFIARFSILQIDYLDKNEYLFRYSTYLLNWNPNYDGVIIGVYLHDLKSPDKSIAVFPAGQAPYFSEFIAFDMLGKSDRHIASLNQSNGNRPGHNKFDAHYIMSKKPTYVFPGLYTPWPESDTEQRKLIQIMKNDLPWLYNLFTNEDFITNCMPFLVNTGSRQDLFQCKWS